MLSHASCSLLFEAFVRFSDGISLHSDAFDLLKVDEIQLRSSWNLLHGFVVVLSFPENCKQKAGVLHVTELHRELHSHMHEAAGSYKCDD